MSEITQAVMRNLNHIDRIKAALPAGYVQLNRVRDEANSENPPDDPEREGSHAGNDPLQRAIGSE